MIKAPHHGWAFNPSKLQYEYWYQDKVVATMDKRLWDQYVAAYGETPTILPKVKPIHSMK